MRTLRPRLGHVRVAATAVATTLALAGAFSPLATRPPASLRGADGLVRLGGADVVLQRRPDGCALAVLVMLLRHAGRSADQEGLAALAASLHGDAPAAVGHSLAQVAEIAARAGLPGDWRRATAADLAHLPTPFAAELAGPDANGPGHLVVVRVVRRAGLLVADPEEGLVAWPADAFSRAWSGRVFLPRTPS